MLGILCKTPEFKMAAGIDGAYIFRNIYFLIEANYFTKVIRDLTAVLVDIRHWMDGPKFEMA